MIENKENLVKAALRYFGFIPNDAKRPSGLVSISELVEADREYKRNSKNIDFLSAQYKVDQAKINRLVRQIKEFIKTDVFIKLIKGSLDSREFKTWKKGADCRKRIEKHAYKLALNL
jgi:hypothetical protein